MTLNDNSRIYGMSVNVDEESVHEFWNKQAQKGDLKSVLLGNQSSSNEQEKRNNLELMLLNRLLSENKIDISSLNVLDLCCGIGRWADNLCKYVKSYTGVDYSDDFISGDIKRFSQTKNAEFICLPVEQIDASNFKRKFDLVIVTGGLMYVNDKYIKPIFQNIKSLVSEYGVVYIQESVSMLDQRLTLNNFYSKDLDSKYSAIYRTIDFYEDCFSTIFTDFDVKEKGILLDESCGARKETNAYYWFLQYIKSK